MELPKPLVVALLTFALAVSVPVPVAPHNGPLNQEPSGRQPPPSPVASESENLFWQSISSTVTVSAVRS